MFALLVVLQVGIVRLALAPLRRVQADVRRLEDGEIDQLGERVPAEVLPLVREVNRLLALLARRLQRSRESLGNLAHALKAPLTVLTHMADDDHVRCHPVLGPQMAEQLRHPARSHRQRTPARPRRRGTRTGRAARSADGDRVAGGDPAQALSRSKASTSSAASIPASRFSGDREDLLELCGNLLDNACKWARSRVLVSVRDERRTDADRRGRRPRLFARGL